METTDVVICGCGPTGAMLSAKLGRHSVQRIILERDEIISTDPRGIALDEDSICCLHACGIYDMVFTDIGQCTGKFKFIGGVHSDLGRKSFTEGGTGHPGFICHKQPAIEKHLRTQINGCSSAQLRVGSTLTSINEDDDWVYATYTDKLGKSKPVRGQFLVGADGKTGFTRKMYLEPRGVALNWKLALPAPEMHPDFLLWAKGYSPQQVYNLFFPIDFRFLCISQRPAVYGRFGLPEDYLWHFEFLVLPEEDGQDMAGQKDA
ncbi:hypothetical protein EDB81DRAFT_842680 [Dactylonectria macrodidyma]|uniref:FAD-binding domain-containing protein n=1 Tax=Dactylonectria macrodidyma TaxID=307937 RepID=A0A9P9J488_9HYPO|nr:hypothetical protein EDB81DRAFT_842680 [Dactylonectria macrodidyma]